MMDWDEKAFQRWAREHGVKRIPGTYRYLVRDIDRAIEAWTREGSPEPTEQEERPDGLDEFERRLRVHGKRKISGR
jgi:nicotinic acid phosphoribosyltransferase